jgi:hypothetical protein
MNSRQNKQAQALAALSPEDRARLERLAARTPLTPDELWPEVWQYGFDDVEESIQADLEADEYFKTNAGIPNAEVMAEARRMVWLLLGRNDDH